MTVYGFKDRKTAVKLKSIAEEYEPQPREHVGGSLPVHGDGWILKTGQDGITAADLEADPPKPGKGDCVPYFINGDGDLVELVPSSGRSTTVEVFNLKAEKIGKDEFIQAKMVGNNPVVDWPDTAAGPATWIKVAKGADESSWTLVEAYDGTPPDQDKFTVACAFDCSCLDEGDELLAFHDSTASSDQSDAYVGAITPAALAGPLVDMKVMDLGDSPGNEPAFECTTGAAPTYDLKFTGQTIRVAKCKNEPTEERFKIGQDLFGCLELCDWFNENCEPYSIPDPAGGCVPCDNNITRAYGSGGSPNSPNPTAAWYENSLPVEPRFPWPEGAGFYTTADGTVDQSGGVCRVTYPIECYEEETTFPESTLTITWNRQADPESPNADCVLEYTQEWNGGSAPVVGTTSFPCDAVSLGIFNVAEYDDATLLMKGNFRFDYAPAVLAMSEVIVQPQMGPRPGLGTRLDQAWPELFTSKSCSCADAIKLLNAWEGDLTDKRMDQVVAIIKRKNPDLKPEDIQQAIRGLMT